VSSSPLRVLAVIPARGGSKGIPRKNLVKFRGKPLLEHTFEAVRGSKTVDLAVVSSEDLEILDFSSTHNFTTIRRRPDIATDVTPMMDVLLDVLKSSTVRSGGVEPEYLLLLQPTSPLRSSFDIDNFMDIVRAHGYQSAVSVHAVREHPMECVQIDASGNWEYVVEPPGKSYGRQTYPDDIYFINGAMYVATPDWIRTHRAFLVKDLGVGFIPMPASRGLDVDTFDDLDRFV